MLHANILIADKDTKFVAMLKSRFEKKNYSVYCATDIKTMIEILDNHWVDLLVLGTGLKGVKNNVEILQKLRKKKNFKTLPVVINTNDKIISKEKYKSLGVLNFFIRPFSLDLFIDEIRDILTKKILVFSNTKAKAKELDLSLQKTGYQIDSTTHASTFFSCITVKWYSLVIIEYSSGKNISDKMVSVVRGNNKSERVPVIVFNGVKTKSLSKDIKKKMNFFKIWSSKIDSCEFVPSPYSIKKIKTVVSEYVDSFK